MVPSSVLAIFLFMLMASTAEKTDIEHLVEFEDEFDGVWSAGVLIPDTNIDGRALLQDYNLLSDEGESSGGDGSSGDGGSGGDGSSGEGSSGEGSSGGDSFEIREDPELCYDTTITDSLKWESRYGHCDSYVPGNANELYCYDPADCDSNDICAYQACPVACGTNKWTEFHTQWAQIDGRGPLLGEGLTMEECQDLCVGNCTAVESWGTGTMKCFAVNYEYMVHYPYENDDSYPPIICIKEDVYHEICSSGCVNGILERPDKCDDDNIFNTDECNNNCTKTFCGDGIMDVRRGEECDDGNAINSDLCTNECRKPKCNDGILDSSEVCDVTATYDPAYINCTNTCTWKDINGTLFRGVDHCKSNEKKNSKGVCGCNNVDEDADHDRYFDCLEPNLCKLNRAVWLEPCDVGNCGNCILPRTQPGCSNQLIVTCVAYIDEFCMYDGWDEFCVDIARSDCGCG